jgi:hypothetical protein
VSLATRICVDRIHPGKDRFAVEDGLQSLFGCLQQPDKLTARQSKKPGIKVATDSKVRILSSFMAGAGQFALVRVPDVSI